MPILSMLEQERMDKIIEAFGMENKRIKKLKLSQDFSGVLVEKIEDQLPFDTIIPSIPSDAQYDYLCFWLIKKLRYDNPQLDNTNIQVDVKWRCNIYHPIGIDGVKKTLYRECYDVTFNVA